MGFNCQSPERRRLSTDQWFMHPEAAADKEQTHWKDGEGWSLMVLGILVLESLLFIYFICLANK